MKNTILALVALLSLSFIAAAASVDGKWTAEVPGRGGQAQTNTFTFKSSGDKVEGSVSNMRGDTPITEGKLTGDTLTFVVVRNRQGTDVKTPYTGKVSGDTIEFTVETGCGDPQKFTAKKAN